MMMKRRIDCLADTWTPLIVQYKTAGDLLLSSDSSEAVVMPAIFLYRQCVELILKRHILISLELLQLPFEEFAKGYQKSTLWMTFLVVAGAWKIGWMGAISLPKKWQMRSLTFKILTLIRYL
jgi:hypothetical protein